LRCEGPTLGAGNTQLWYLLYLYRILLVIPFPKQGKGGSGSAGLGFAVFNGEPFSLGMLEKLWKIIMVAYLIEGSQSI
jgi:hypothetical protein